MSPAMVDFRSPASASSKLRSNRHRSKVSVRDQIPSFPSHPIFKSGGIPDPSPPMERLNLGQGVPVPSPASFPRPPFSYSTASEKLSAPRLRKQRKYSGTSRARPAVISSDSGTDQGFNSFGPPVSHDDTRDRVEDRGSQSVREQLDGWKPFVPNASSQSSSGAGFIFGVGSSGSISSSSNIVSESNNGSGIFMFGSGVEKDSSLSRSSSQSSSAQSLGSADFTKSEGTKPIPGTRTSTYSNVARMPFGGSVFPFGADNAKFDTGGFDCGSGAKKVGKSRHNLPFGADNNSFYKLNTKKPVTEKNGKTEPVFCVHTSGEKKNIYSSTSSSFNTDDSLLREQTERTRKIDLGNPNGTDCHKDDGGVFLFGSCRKAEATLDPISSMHSDESSVISLSRLPDDLGKLKIEASRKVANLSEDPGVNKSSCVSKCSSFGAFECSFSKLPENMEKLNLHSSYAVHDATTSDVFETETSPKNAQFSRASSALDEGGFKFPGESESQNLQGVGNEEHGNDKHGFFVLGSNVREKANSDKSSSLSFDKSMDPCVFIFGSGVNKNTCASKSSSFGSSECSFSKLPMKMEKLNLHSSAHAVHEDTTSVTSGSSSKKAQLDETSSGLDRGGFSKFPMESKKQNLQSSGNEEQGNGNHGVFVFGSDVQEKINSSKSSSLSFDESSTFDLPDEIRKMKLNGLDNEVDSHHNKPVSSCNQHHKNSFFCASDITLQFVKEDSFSRVAPLRTCNSFGLSAETSFSPSQSPGFQSSGSDFCFTSMHTVSETPKMEFKSKKQDTSMLTKENLFTEPHRTMNFGMKKEDPKGSRLKKKRGKSRQSATIRSGTTKQLVHEDEDFNDNLEQGYSPMDYSPYQETLVSDQHSREASVASDETIHFDSRCTLKEAQRSSSLDVREGELRSGSGEGEKEELFSTEERFSANEGRLKSEASDCGSSLHFSSECSLINEKIPVPRKKNLSSKDETFQPGVLKKSSSVESESFNFDSCIKQTAFEGSTGFSMSSKLGDTAQSNFLFGASSLVQGPSSASRRIYRRKSRGKGCQDRHPNTKMPISSSTSNEFLFPNAHVPTDPRQELKDNADCERPGKANGTKAIQESATIDTASAKAEESCEKWRLRGNLAYADGDLSKAEDYYSRGVDFYSPKEVSKICSRALMLCYSNRAATRMSLGRLREALSDCMMAIAIDPNFLRARVRAGNIFLSLGEPADARQHFEKVLQFDKEAKSDQKILSEAIDGSKKAQMLNDLMDQSSIYLTKRTPDDVTKALEIISEALTFGPYSEILLEMKAEALIKLRRFEEAIQICEQTLELAEKNAVITDSGSELKDDNGKSYVRLWRWRIISKSYFYLGKLEEANELLKKHEKVKPVIDKYWSKNTESPASFPVIVCELLRLKAAGNEAFQAGKHLEAVELYTAALALNTDSRSFTAICFCNRAAAYQALGQITDAIADCSLAIALDSSYRKAISRRATLHEMIRDYGQAVIDLRKLTTLLELSSEDKCCATEMLGRSSSNVNDLNQVRLRLCTAEEDARKGGTLDLYMILGIERSCSAADVRKAYRKAALRHHPDKAGQFLSRSDSGDDRVWKEVAEEVHTNADRLFKMIGEAYSILVDPSKRSQYDAELESRNVRKNCGAYGGSSSPRTPASSHSSHFERSSDPRQWRSYGSTHRQWSNW